MKSDIIGIRVSKKLKKKIKTAAEKNEMTITVFICQILIKYFKGEKK